MSGKPKTDEVLARNLRALMTKGGLVESALAQKSNVSQKAINNVLNCRTTAKIETVELLAKAFGMEGWQLLLPNLPDEVDSVGAIGRLIQSYSKASAEGQRIIMTIAEREARYGN